MSDAPSGEGQRRIDRILVPGYADALPEMELDELRSRRDLCRAEREYLSFLRRLLQGRRDLLRDELERRRTGTDPGPLVERITAVLAMGSRSPSRGEAVLVPMPEEEISLARRRIEKLLSDAHLSNLEALSEQELDEAIERIDREEREVSESRNRVMEIHDRFQEELKRRYRAELKDLRA